MNSEDENAFLKEKFPELLETREITGEIVIDVISDVY